MLLIYFVLGFAREAVVTFYFKSVAARRAYSASASTLILSVMDFFVIAKVIMDKNLWLFLAYAVGEALGTWTVMQLPRKK